MKINLNFDKCICCLENSADSLEHVIPCSIGGRLQIKMLCSNCNNNSCSKLVSKIKEDPSVRLAVRNLKNKIPELFETMENGQMYNATNINGDHIKLKYKNRKFKTKAQKKEDNSLILDTKKASENIRQTLSKKDGLSENEIEDKIESFQKLEDNKFLQLSGNRKIIKWSIESIFPNLQGPFINENAIVLMAYEFLSILVGNLIYENRFNFIREFIIEEKKSKKIIVERLMSRHYSPYHKIYPEFLETEIVINIILFRCLVYKVHLKGFKLIGDADFVYLEDLENKKTLIAKSVSEAKQGIYYEH